MIFFNYKLIFSFGFIFFCFYFFIIQECASKDFDFVPRQSALRQLTGRCVLTSRPRGNLLRWRISRFIFRNVSDHNQLSGVQRAMW